MVCAIECSVEPHIASPNIERERVAREEVDVSHTCGRCVQARRVDD